MKKTVVHEEQPARRSLEGEGGDMHADLAECKNLYLSPLFSASTRAAYRTMFADLHARRADDMIKENIVWLRATLAEARSYTEQFQSKMSEALANRWINAESAARWQKRFHDPSLLECIRKHWFNEHFLGLLTNWKTAAETRGVLLKKPLFHEVSSADVPRLSTFKTESLFLSLHWRERAALNAEVAAAILAKENGQQHFYAECAIMLRGWASGPNRFLHPSKIGTWLQRIFTGTFSESERRRFVEGTLHAYRKNWERLRHQFDTVVDEIQHKGIPAGFFVPTVDEFLAWHANQRETYVAEAKNRLRSPQEEPANLRHFKQDIRHNLDSRDWDGAAKLLTVARQEFPDDLDLKSMERFLQAHRVPIIKSAINENPDQILKNMHTLVSQLDTSVQSLYIKALKEGSDVFRALTVLMFNRVWLHRNGRYLTTTMEAEQQHSREYKEETRMRMRQGHTDEIERNILSGDTAKEAAINDDCTNAQILYMNSGGEDAVLSRVREQRSNQSDGARGFLYQTSLIPIDLPYGKHEQIVDHLHQPFKQGLRALEEQGKSYE